jgi:hypothetical protein
MLKSDLYTSVKDIADREGVKFNGESPGRCFRQLIDALYSKYGRKPAVLIDEYDAPILSQIGNQALAKDIQSAMSTFYGALKAAEKSRGFTFITGITKFSQTSVFSKLNLIVDLTLDEDFVNICGLTLEELDSFIDDQMDETDPQDPEGRPLQLTKFTSKGSLLKDATVELLREELINKYDGYSWDGNSRLLNPWSVVSVFNETEFENFWLNTGPSRFLSQLLGNDFKIHEIFSADNFLSKGLNVVEVGNMQPLALMFQAGYLTVASKEFVDGAARYYLRFPNLEVESAVYGLTLNFCGQNTFRLT